MAVLKAGSTVGGVSLLLQLKPSNLTEGAGEVNQFLGVDIDNTVKFLSAFKSQAQGAIAGFTSGGDPAAPASVDTIDRFPFTSPFTVATDVGNLSLIRSRAAGQSSSVEGFTSGGVPLLNFTRIDKFPFTAPFTTATTAGALNPGRYSPAGQSSTTEGFTSGGSINTDGSISSFVSTIDKFPFTAPFTTATNIGSLSQARSSAAGQSSTTEGFTSGGMQGIVPSFVSTIDKFPFTAPFTTATNIGSLSQARYNQAGQSSATEGYTSGGEIPSSTGGSTNRIDRFPFTAPFATATNVGSLSQARLGPTGQSSTTDGYNSGGVPSITSVTTIDMFPFTAPFTTATSAGALSQGRGYAAGQQY